MSAHVLLNLLNEVWKRDKMRGLPSILPLFRNEFNKLYNTGARMIVSFYLSHDIKTLRTVSFGVKHIRFPLILRNVKMDVITFPVNR